MQYEIIGGNLPAVICSLKAGEEIVCENGGMSWMDDVFSMKTKGGGFGKMLGRAFTNESVFRNIYHANRDGDIAFASSFPGEILAIEISNGRSVVAQKSAFLACTPGVDMSVFFQKKLSAGLFGGEGFLMQQFTGNGIVFLEIDGAFQEYELGVGERFILDTGHLVMMDATCKLTVESVKGLKNKFLGGEGLFNTVVTGPGRVMLQTMPLSGFASAIASVLPKSSS